jgi:hypothetical protein
MAQVPETVQGRPKVHATGPTQAGLVAGERLLLARMPSCRTRCQTSRGTRRNAPAKPARADETEPLPAWFLDQRPRCATIYERCNGDTPARFSRTVLPALVRGMMWSIGKRPTCAVAEIWQYSQRWPARSATAARSASPITVTLSPPDRERWNATAQAPLPLEVSRFGAAGQTRLARSTRRAPQEIETPSVRPSPRGVARAGVRVDNLRVSLMVQHRRPKLAGDGRSRLMSLP